jgi:two-component system, sensor histidine kinase and response regulator
METLKVLVVDDEPGIRLGVVRVLQSYHPRLPELEGEVRFELDQADSGEAALEKVGAAPPDLLLLDHKLPGLSGLEVLERLRGGAPDLLVVMITAYATIETAVSATKRGAHDFLAKPFTPEELKSTVYKAAKHLLLQREARRLAAEKRHIRFQFISVLAHELKAPLAAVEGYLQILRDGVVAPGSEKSTEILGRSVARIEGMRKLIGDILDLTRIESGQRARDVRVVDVVEVARRAMEMVLPIAEPRGIAIDLHGPDPVELSADPSELEIMLNNLLSNAVKYNRDGGRVDVSVSLRHGRVVLAVADTGIGMTEEETAKLFGEFVRIKNAKTRAIPGSGLGLSIVKKLAALYDGDVTVASQPDIGTTFTVSLKAEAAGASRQGST